MNTKSRIAILAWRLRFDLEWRFRCQRSATVHERAARITPVITQIELLGNFQQQPVDAFEPTQTTPVLHQADEESAPFFLNPA